MVTDKEWENHSEEWRDGYNAFNNGNVLKVDFSMMPKDWRDGARYAAQHPCGNAYTAITGRMLEKNRRYDITQNSICRSDRPDAVCVGVWHCLRQIVLCMVARAYRRYRGRHRGRHRGRP